MKFRCDDIKNLVVKIQYLISSENKEKYRESTGVILRPKDKTNYFFILTTKHSFKEHDEQSFKDVEVDKLNSNDVDIFYKKEHSFQPFKIIDTQSDLVVIVVESSFCVDDNIENIKILDTEFTSCGFTGYADVSNGRLKCFDKCTYSIEHDKMIFEINSNTVLQSSSNDETLATIGLSGSGVFTLVNNKYMLTGIISRVITDNNSFDCVNLGYLLKDISLDAYGEIEIISLEKSFSNNNSISEREKSIDLNLEKLQIIVQEQISKELEELKNNSVNGVESNTQEWIDEIKKSSTKWNALTNIQKAEILYEEAKVLIAKKELDEAKRILDKIRDLDPSRYINRLLSWIELRNNNSDKAIELLDNDEVATLNQKASVYISIGEYTKAKDIIDNMSIDNRNYETYRVKSIYELYNNANVDIALKSINKSLELNPNYLEAKRVKAIILFYDATIYSVIPDLVPPITQKNMLKIDKKSQKSIEESKKIFLEIDKTSTEYRDKAWLASVQWLTNKEDAIRYLNELYENDVYKNITIQFVIIYGLDINIESDIKNIELKHDIDLYEADTLIRYYLVRDNGENVLVLLEEYKQLYITHSKEENWNEYYINSLLGSKLYEDIFKFIDQHKIEKEKELKAHVYRLKNDYKTAYSLYEELYNEDKNPHYRLVICEMKAEENNWEYITEYTNYLIENFQIEKVIELVVYAEYNTKNYTKAKQLIKQWIGHIKNEFIIDNFKRIEAECENQSGFPEQAISIIENNNLINTDKDLFTLAKLYQKTGEQDKIEDLLVKYKEDEKIELSTKLQVASLIENRQPIIKEILKGKDITKTDKELSLLLFQNGIIDNFVMKNIQEMANDDKYPVAMINIANFHPLMEDIRKQNAYNYDVYQKGDLAIHLLNNFLPSAYLKNNVTTIYIRGAKKFNFVNLENMKNNILYLDITSLLLLFSINLIEQIVDAFSTIYLPANIYITLEELNTPDRLTKMLKTYFKLGHFVFCPEVDNLKIKENDPPSNLVISLASMLEANNAKKAMVCIDDRFANNFQNTQHEKQIISTIDILFSFYNQKIIDRDKYFSFLLDFRKRKYLYILITTEEIIYHLKKSSIVNEKIIESEDLKVLKNHLNFLVEHFRYIKSFTQGELQANQYAEPFFVINQEREIQNSIIELWNEEFEYKEDRYIYLNWIMENIFVFNMSYFIRNKLPHSDDVTMTMSVIGMSSLLTQAITIGGTQNQKLYFDWFYNNYLNRFFISNPELFENCLDHIKEIVVKTFIKEDSKDIEKAIVQNLIMNFPDKIKNALGSVRQIQNEFLMGRVISLGEFKFIDRVLIEKVTKVINGGQKVLIHTMEEPVEAITVVSKMIQNKKEIEIIYGNGDKVILDRRFFILSASAKKRRELICEHPEWLDMSNTRKKCVIKDLNSIKIHYDRFEALHKLIEKSSFYKNIEDNLKERKITFQNLCPEDINILLDHFRLDETLSIKEIFNVSTETLLSEENIYKTINIVQNLPIEFSDKIINHLGRMPFIEQKKVLFQMLRISRSPISVIHLLKVLLKLNIDKFHLITRYLINQIFIDKFQLEFKVFVAVLNYVKQEFNRRYIHLNNDIKLALIWGHTNKLIRYFNAYHVDYSWIIENFQQQTNIISLEIFRPDSEYNRDILNDSFSYERFIVSSLCYAYENDFNKSQGEYTINKINKLVDFDKNSFNFIRLNVKTENAVNSFLEMKDISILSNFTNIEESLKIIYDFILTPQDNNILLSILFLKYDVEKLNPEEEKRLIKYIDGYDLSTNKPTEIEFYNVLFMIKQLKNISDKAIAKKVIEFLFKLSESIETEKEAGLLIELLIYLSIYRVEKLEIRIKLFVKYISTCKKLHKYDFTKQIINKFINELPLKYSNYFLLLKFNMSKK